MKKLFIIVILTKKSIKEFENEYQIKIMQLFSD